jgi:hypothetical protein
MTLDGRKAKIKKKYVDAEYLLNQGSYANCCYLCGYCVELALKYKIAKHLKWPDFRLSSSEKTLKSHNLDLLLRFTGIVGLNTTADWSVVKDWNESIRYANPSDIVQADAQGMLTATKNVVRRISACLLKR